MNRNEKEKIPARAEETVAAQESGKSAAQYSGAAQRDFRSEMKALIERYSEVREMLQKGGELPEEVLETCVKEDIPLQLAYAEYAMRQAQREAQKLREENGILRQNAQCAAKAPVKGASHGSANETRKDPFLEGFFGED
ncbi:MAG: hypothetical protein IKM11_01480 [Oscillospiraceae bacterium]|nr:hypothetical protein [Oscillospiraceae bacterium]